MGPIIVKHGDRNIKINLPSWEMIKREFADESNLYYFKAEKVLEKSEDRGSKYVDIMGVLEGLTAYQRTNMDRYNTLNKEVSDADNNYKCCVDHIWNIYDSKMVYSDIKYI